MGIDTATTFDDEYDLYSPFQYPWMTFNFFVGFWFTEVVVRFVLSSRQSRIVPRPVRARFLDLSEDKKRNAITYVMQFLATSVAFFAQILGGRDILFKGEDETSAELMGWAVFSIQVIVVLYIWELVYREKIGVPLLIHHLVTILLTQLVIAAFNDTDRAPFLRYALLLGFHATTEQLSFVALLAFRLKFWQRYQGLLFFIATVQAFIFKTFVTVVSVIYFVYLVDRHKGVDDKWVTYWKIAFLPLLACLYAAQLYSCRILFVLGKRCESQHEQNRDAAVWSGNNNNNNSSSNGRRDEESGDNRPRRTSALRRFNRRLRRLLGPCLGISEKSRAAVSHPSEGEVVTDEEEGDSDKSGDSEGSGVVSGDPTESTVPSSMEADVHYHETTSSPPIQLSPELAVAPVLAAVLELQEATGPTETPPLTEASIRNDALQLGETHYENREVSEASAIGA